MVFDFESSSSKKSEYRVAIAVVDSVVLDVIIITDITVILSRFDWILNCSKFALELYSIIRSDRKGKC